MELKEGQHFNLCIIEMEQHKWHSQGNNMMVNDDRNTNTSTPIISEKIEKHSKQTVPKHPKVSWEELWPTQSQSGPQTPQAPSSSSSNTGSRSHTRSSALSTCRARAAPRWFCTMLSPGGPTLHWAWTSGSTCPWFRDLLEPSTLRPHLKMWSAIIPIQAAIPDPYHKSYSIFNPLQSYTTILKTIKNITFRNYRKTCCY